MKPQSPPNSTDTSERFMPSHITWVRINRSSRPWPGHDQQLTSTTKPAAAAATRITVQQRDDHRHVGTTDGQRHADAEQTGANYQQPQTLGPSPDGNQLDCCHRESTARAMFTHARRLCIQAGWRASPEAWPWPRSNP
ncbi:MAG: hypothetical protein CM15mP77_4230 [Synechococcus sp.]|nr:MAG: hypothetical protein CM15mP77_4230 [Synechococcus sp.]